MKAYSDCTNPSGTALTSYLGYDIYGHPVASVDPVGVANSSFYSSQGLVNKNGCAFAQSALPPVYLSTTWTAGRFTTCAVYDTPYEAQLASSSNAFGQTTAMSYDYTEGAVPSSVTDPNGQTGNYSYSYDGSSATDDKAYAGFSEPGENGQFTSQSNTYSFCASSIPGGITHPCYEINGTSAAYPNLVSSTFYDSLGRPVETSVPGPTPPSPQSGMSYFTVTTTVHNDQANSVWQSLPFVVAVQTHSSGQTGMGWLDPNTVTDYTGAGPGGTATFFDALGRVVATQDPMWNSSQEPGITCPNLLATTTYTDCTFYGLGNAQGDSTMYSFVGSIDPNNHVSVSFANMYGWTLYTQHYSGTYTGSGGIGGISGNLVEQIATQENVLGEPLSITTTDEKPQSGETASVTVSAHYDDLGRVTDSSDPETGSFTYTYDPDGRLLTAVSGSRTLGSNYDLLGRIGCVQTAAPTIDADGSCTGGTQPLLQYTYDTDALGTAGSTDFPVGRLTKTVATTSYPDSGTPTASAITKYQYDTRGRIITTQLKFNLPSGWGISALPTYQAATSYNDADQVTSTSTSTIVNNTPTPQFTDAPIYDPNTGVLTGLGTDGSGNPTLGTLAYTPTAQVGTVTFLSAGGAALVNEQYSYDGNLRLIGASACWQSLGCNNTGGTIFSQVRTFDVASNATSATTQLAAIGAPGAAGSETQIFCYDSQNRLVWAGNTGTPPSPGAGTCGSGTPSTSLSSGSYQTAYQYTHLDQLWQGPFNGSGTQQYLYCNSSAPHQLTGIYNASATCSSKSGKVYGSTYDAWGNVITRTLTNEAQPNTANLSYDPLNQFIEWQDTDPNTNQTTSQWNLDDASGTRVLQRATDASGTTTLTVYPFGDEEYHYTANGTLLTNLHYDSLGGQLLAERTGGSTPTTTMLLTDTLGSVISTFSNKGSNPTVLGNQLYDPYGTQRYQQGSIDSTTNRGFTGQYNDTLTGLDDYGARFYDPASGVFLSADSVQGNTTGQNPYAYVGGNPETMTDPSGTMASACVDGPGCSSPPATGTGDGSAESANGTNATPGGNTTGSQWGSGWFKAFLIGVSIGVAGAFANPYPHIPITITPTTSSISTANTTVTGGDDSSFPKAVNGAMLSTFYGIHFHFGDGTSPSGSNQPGGNNKPTAPTAVPPEVDGGPPPMPHVGPECSFTPTTQVMTKTGTQSIGNLKVGVKVLAYNPKTGKMELEPILHVWIHTDNDLIDLTITTKQHAPHSTKATTTKEVLHTNQKHPFFTIEKGFVPVGQLTLGMHVLSADGYIGVITGWKVVPGAKVMYNLEVAQDHTFVVGTGEWVVHNRCDSGPLRKAIGLSTGDPYQAHHIIPCELSASGKQTHSLLLAAQAGNEGYVNGAWNGIALPSDQAFSDLTGLPFHNNKHSNYTGQVQQLLDLVEMSIYEKTPGPISPDDARNALSVVAQFLSVQIGSAGGNVCIDDVNLL